MNPDILINRLSEALRSDRPIPRDLVLFSVRGLIKARDVMDKIVDGMESDDDSTAIVDAATNWQTEDLDAEDYTGEFRR